MGENSDAAFVARINAIRARIDDQPQHYQQPQQLPLSSINLFRDQASVASGYPQQGYGYGSAAYPIGFADILPQSDRIHEMRTRERRRRKQRIREIDNTCNTLIQTAGYVLAKKGVGRAAEEPDATSKTKSTLDNGRDEALVNRLDLVLEQNSQLQALLVDQASYAQNFNGTRDRHRSKPRRRDKVSFSPSSTSIASASLGGRNVDAFPHGRNMEESMSESDSEEEADGEEDRAIKGPIGPKGIDLSAKNAVGDFEGGSKKLSEASTWFAQRMNPSQNETKDSKPLAILSESEDEKDDLNEDEDSYVVKDLDDETSMESRHKMRAEIRKKLGIIDLMRPRWRISDGEEMPQALMKGKMLFRAIARVPTFIQRLHILVRKANTAAILSDQKDVAEFMGLYRDLSKNWLASLIKVPVLSVVKNAKLNLNIEDEKKSKSNFAKRFFTGNSAEMKKNMLMQCKVRVKGIIDILLSSCRVNSDTSGTGAGKGVPRKLCEFFAKYFVSDGIAFPPNYIWESEANKLEFSAIGTEKITRRMVYKNQESSEESTSSVAKSEEKKEKDIDLLLNTQENELNTERPRLLITNFLLGRVLCESVLLAPSTCPALAVGKEISLKSKRNLQYIASMLYLILARYHDDLPLPSGSAIDITPVQKKNKTKQFSKGVISAADRTKVQSNGKQNNLENPDIFTVTFVDGPLGLDLKAHKSNGIGAVIFGISIGTQADKKRRLEEGQVLLKIGKRKVNNTEFGKILGMIKKMKRPVRMTFREHLSISKCIDKITVPFPAGPLGLDLSHGDANIGTVVSSSKLGAIKPGDLVAKVGKLNVADLSLDETISHIQEAKRPVTLVFFRARDKPKETESPEEVEEPDKADKADKKSDKADKKSDKADKKSDKADKKSDKSNKSDKTGKSDKSDKSGKSGKSDKKSESKKKSGDTKENDATKGSGKVGGENKEGKDEDSTKNGQNPSDKDQWSSSHELANKLITLDVFKGGCDKKGEGQNSVLGFEDWLDTQADRLEMWAGAIISEVMIVARDMQKKG